MGELRFEATIAHALDPDRRPRVVWAPVDGPLSPTSEPLPAAGLLDASGRLTAWFVRAGRPPRSPVEPAAPTLDRALRSHALPGPPTRGGGRFVFTDCAEYGCQTWHTWVGPRLSCDECHRAARELAEADTDSTASKKEPEDEGWLY